MRLTTPRWALDGGEVLTTCVAFAVSVTLYVRDGHSYLARGVVGDLLGFGFLTAVLATCHRRLRHEALVCLAAILLVLATNPQWPLRLRSTWWWLGFAVGITAYLVGRRRLLSG